MVKYWKGDDMKIADFLSRHPDNDLDSPNEIIPISFVMTDILHDNKSTGGSRLSRIFWEHENQSGLLVIQLICIKLYREMENKFWKKIWAKRVSGLSAVRLKRDPPVLTK